MIRVAVVGTGYWGPNLARNLHELGALAAVCDLAADRAVSVAARFGVPALADIGAVLADPDIEAVALATPVSTHAPLALAALQASKHVFVEKPLALSVAEGRELCDEADGRRRVLMVGHLLEYHPAFEAIKGLLASGELGEIRHVRCARLNLGRLRSEENVLWSFAPHDISLVLRLAGREPDAVRATGYRLLGTPREDVVYAELVFDGAFSAHIQVGWVEPIKLHHFMVVGSRRIAVFNDVLAPGDKLKLYDKGFDPGPGGLALRDGPVEPVAYEPAEPMRRELEAFLAACETGGPVVADGPSGLRVVRTLERLTSAMESIACAPERVRSV